MFSFDSAKIATFLLSLQVLPRKIIQKRHILDPNQGYCVRTQLIAHILAVALTFVSNCNNNDGKAQLYFLNESKMAFKEKRTRSELSAFHLSYYAFRNLVNSIGIVLLRQRGTESPGKGLPETCPDRTKNGVERAVG